MARIGGNPETYYKTDCPEQVAKKSISVKLPLELDTFVRSLPNKAEWLRQAIAEKAERDLKQKEDQSLC